MNVVNIGIIGCYNFSDDKLIYLGYELSIDQIIINKKVTNVYISNWAFADSFPTVKSLILEIDNRYLLFPISNEEENGPGTTLVLFRFAQQCNTLRKNKIFAEHSEKKEV